MGQNARAIFGSIPAMPSFRTLDDLRPQGKRVLVREDFNVPLKDGRVTDATRIERAVPTLRELSEKGAKVIALSHFGRPRGKPDPAFSLKPLVEPLSRAVGGKPVAFAKDCVGPEAERVVAALKPGDVALLENLRFHPEEEANDIGFARKLAALGDLYVNDAFSASHRAHASIEALPRLLPAAAGRLMQAELEALTAALETPQRPVAALVGGAKVSTKLDLLNNLVRKVNVLVIGGAMANTLLFARGIEIGKSLSERDMAETARGVLAKAREAGCEILLPLDAVVARELTANAASETVAIESVPKDAMILDIGPRTVAAIGAKLEACRTLVWNGPLGAFETPPFERGTVAVARRVAELTRAKRLLSVAGGGDTVAALAQAGVTANLTYASTAGGAFLEWLEGRELPGVAALLRH
jgi:phosphoglycerate kinase